MPALDLSTVSEADWQQQVIDLAHTLGWRHMFVRKSIGKGRKWTTATNVPGWLDLVLWSERRQRVIFVELKTEKGVVSPDQEAMLASWHRTGQEAYVWRPSDLDAAVEVLTRR